MAELNINEAIQLMKKCKNMLISGESSKLDSELIIIDQILNLLRIDQTNDKSTNRVKKDKFKELELLLKNEEFTKITKNYMVKFPESIFIDEPAFLEYWSHLTSMEKESLSLVELKIAYYLITKNFDSRVKVKKNDFLARIDDLVSIRNRRENLSKSTMNQNYN